jgi:uncharacterized protein (UPF0179 family)
MEEIKIDRTPKLGDHIKVINPGCLYASYKDAAYTMGLKNWKEGYSMVKTDQLYLIINDYIHSGEHRRILGITDGIRDFIIREDGVEVVDDESRSIFVKTDMKKSIQKPVIIFDVENLDLVEINPDESENSSMTENLQEMVEGTEGQQVAEGDQQQAVEQVAAEANQLVADAIQAETIAFCESLSSDVKAVTHGNNTSIKFKNKNFVYLTRNKKKNPPLKVQVKQGKEWPVITLDAQAGFDGLKQIIQDSFNSIQS